MSQHAAMPLTKAHENCVCGFPAGEEHVCCGEHKCCEHHEHPVGNMAGISRTIVPDSIPEGRRESVIVAVGATLLAAGLVLEHIFHADVFIFTGAFILSYVVLAFDVAKEAVSDFKEGSIFNENLLMLVASIGAMAISNYPEGIAVVLLYRIGEMFEDMAIKRNRSEIERTVDMRPETVNLLVNDHTRAIDAGDAEVGDVILVRPGERIPLDGVIISGSSLVDTSPITGEPVPVKYGEGEYVLSGAINETGVLKMRVEKALEESMVSRILHAVEDASANKPKVDRFITRFAAVYTPAVMGLALAVAVIPSLITGNWSYWVYTALTFLVISCPCAIVISVPLAFFSGIGAGSRRGILFKGGAAIEAMKNVKAVVFDKTGTITEGSFAVRKIETFGMLTENEVLSLCAGCEAFSTHPIAESIKRKAAGENVVPAEITDIKEYAGKGISGFYAGKKIILGNRDFLRESGVAVSDEGAVGTQVELSVDGIHQGRLIIYDCLKSEAKRVLRTLQSGGLRTVMLTGDEERSALRIAAETGINEYHAGLMPDDKLTIMQDIRKREGAVMFVGDGINDAPVLAGADVGAAMGSGCDAAIEASDMVLMTSNLEAVSDAFKISKNTLRIAKQNIIFALGFKAAIMLLGVMGFASMWLAVIADTGVAMVCILNSIRLLYKRC